ncbi:zinc-dependent metalloprotease [Flavobacterium sp. NKUCC04_CG]|uniref:zinc-dependent metalloprotease n=1 Tax=Flavobacterium sp. NKUCC04_CG TaxID=2842121 RepID=UPI001C5BABDE|nr:zinc-dependent metalloprotease [Flavobacterium sp. NKUCC04_CG]MBW3520147.1 T9SS type A sorting domain-containing protein [Flavobacterium sp. NKUCC04_CG]
MKKKYFWGLFAFAIFSYGQAQNNLWKTISEKDVAKSEKLSRSSNPMNYEIYNLNINQLKNSLKDAPLDTENTVSKTIISFPNSTGKLERFEIYKAPIMEQGLADKFTEIMSYSGKSLDKPGSSIRFSVTLFGLHAVNYSAENGTSYIDTYTNDLKSYIVYNRDELNSTKPAGCLVTDMEKDFPIDSFSTPSALRLNNQGVFRQYRLAMACTIEYAKFHIDAAQEAQIPVATEAQKKAAVLSAMTATMTRVNFIFERDLAIRMNFVTDNDKILFLTADEFSNTDSNLLINESQRVIDRVITPEKYDIGHTVSTGSGGLAGLAVPCNNATKARGVTGSANPVGDTFDVDFVAHEMGHQFGAAHTFNNFCVDPQISPLTAVEPGSGSSIMGYAGVCQAAPDGSFLNVQGHSDPFFHGISIAQISDFIATFGACSQNRTNNNPAPIANAGDDKIIPKLTPFKLTGSATDENNQNLTYSWEQMDNQLSPQPPVSTSTIGPLFRVYAPTQSPDRHIPNYQDVLTGISRMWEVLPSVQRTLNFNLVVRDNHAVQGGQTSTDDLKIIVSNAGPFQITHPNSGRETWQANTPQVVNWNVAGTNTNNINTTFVNILFSSDNGQTFITLKENTPNDGTESIIAPDYNSLNCRILIEPVGNIYYTISKKFSVLGGSTAGIDSFGLDDFRIYPNPTNDIFTIQFESNSTNDVGVQIHDMRGRLISKESYKNTGSFQQQINLSNAQSGIYIVTVEDGLNKEVKKVIKK